MRRLIRAVDALCAAQPYAIDLLLEVYGYEKEAALVKEVLDAYREAFNVKEVERGTDTDAVDC